MLIHLALSWHLLCFCAYKDKSAQLCLSASWRVSGWTEIQHIFCGRMLPIPENVECEDFFEGIDRQTDRQTDKQRDGEKGNRGIGERTR